MSLAYDQKEDLRLRMADLERKLAESEEERSKLEKTCNVLMRAFREEEKMQYRALNRKYEKFLEDCSVRKRRNDIIMRSLCRIEDRSRALYAKTERLKLLKDRYISYLKINDVRKGETHSWRPSYSSPSPERITNVAAPKYVQWTTPLATHLETRREASPSSRGSSTYGGIVEKYERENTTEKGRKADGISLYNGITNIGEAVRTLNVRDETGVDSSPVPSRSENRMKPEKGACENDMKGDKGEKEAIAKKVINYDESIERVKALLSEEERVGNGDDPYDGEIVEKDDLEQSEKDSIIEQNDARFPNSSHTTPGPNTMVQEEAKDVEEYPEEEDDPPKSLPMGLDGVDYQNETYPESYYEQPVHHHNHTSIASDVILEEDETEQDCEEPKDVTPEESLKGGEANTWASPGEPERTPEANADEPGKGQEASNEVRSQKSDSEKSSGQSEKPEKSDKGKTGKSNLIHLLESDSESFQIEHGDGVSGNEDSDFDFSFHQN